MDMTQTAERTRIVAEVEFCASPTNDTNQPARVYVDVDPETGEQWCHVYSDDGRGNGMLIFKFRVAEAGQ